MKRQVLVYKKNAESLVVGDELFATGFLIAELTKVEKFHNEFAHKDQVEIRWQDATGARVSILDATAEVAVLG